MPVYSHIHLDYGALGLGRRIRQLRKDRGWTLQQLSSKLDLSIASLSAIENEKAVLDLDQLVRVSGALGIPADVLVPRSRSSHYFVARRTMVEAQEAAALKVVDQATGAMTPYHNLLRPLAEPFVGKHIEPFHIEIEPVTDEQVQFICHHHEEFFFVLRGEVECLLKTPDGLVRELLAPGDCMYFWSFLPHCIRSTGPQAAAAIHLLYAAHGATDSEQANGGTGDIIFFREAANKSLSEQVAAKITGLRQARGMSIADLARELEVGVRQLAEIERGRKPVSLRFLLRVGRAFRKPLDYFLAGTLAERPFYSRLRASEIKQLWPRVRRRGQASSAPPPAEYRSLAENFRNRGMYPYYVKVRGTDPDARMREHHGQEFVYVLNGEVTLHTVQDNRPVSETLSAGDACFIDSTVPHRLAAAGFDRYENSAAEIIDIFWCPLGEGYLFEAPAGDAASIPGRR